MQILGLEPGVAVKKEVVGTVEKEVPIGVDDVLKRGAGNGCENRFALHKKHNGRGGTDEDRRRLQVGVDGMHGRIGFFNAGNHAIETDGEDHSWVNLAHALLHGGFLCGVERRKTGAEDFDVTDEYAVVADVGDGVGMPGNYSEDGFGVWLLNGHGRVGDEGTVGAPAFDLRLVDDDVRSIAIEDPGPGGCVGRGGRRGRSSERQRRR